MNKNLDSIRFYAFLGVFLYHLKFLDGGYLGVQAFFVLSGFLLTPNLIELKKFDFGQFLSTFYGRRALRIFPVYYAYLFVVGLVGIVYLHWLKHPLSTLTNFFETLPTTLTYTYNFYHASAKYEHNPLTNHFWSLAVEEQFYLIWPLFIWFIPTKTIRRVLVALVALGPILRLGTYCLARFTSAKLWLAFPELVIYVVPWSHIDAFALGGLFALTKSVPKFLSAKFMLLATLIAGFVIELLAKKTTSWHTLGYPSLMNGNYRFVWAYSLVNLSFAMLIKKVSLNLENLPTLDWPLVQYLGKISYGLYIFHFPCIYLFSSSRLKMDNLFLNTLAIFSTSVFLSIISYEAFEKHFLKLKDVWFQKSISKVQNQGLILDHELTY